tara:strand:- start:2868 stop:3827 length:960 start_codon:yes stop_codon:yes gene_type:complete
VSEGTVFDRLSVDRDEIKWESYLSHLTPWHNKAGIWFKREDYFAPLGYGGPNGSKMRQLIWYVNRFKAGKDYILTGASIQSPQLSMSAIVGYHYGMLSRQVVYSKPHTVKTHDNPRIAAGFGAEFDYASGPYNPIIQKRVEDLRERSSLVVEYGITVPHHKHPAEDVKGFHDVGAYQTVNIPDEVEVLVIPAGSCNSLTSILLGLSKDPHNLKEIFTLGIGPDKMDWVRQRLKIMGVDTGYLPFRWRHYSLHDNKYCAYSDKFNGESFEGIQFHPTYEAKVWRYLRENAPLPQDGCVGFWIIGSAPKTKVIEPFYPEIA